MTLMEWVPLIAALLVAGAFAGVLSGLLGVGGGVVLVPAFVAIFTAAGYHSDQLMQMCLATSLGTMIITSSRSVMAHNRRGAVDWSILRTWAPWLVIGAVLGALLVSHLRTATLQAIFAVLVFAIALWMGFSRQHWRLADHLPGGLWRWTMGTVVGFLSVLLGIGGGSFAVPLMTLHNIPIHRAVATASGFGVVLAIPSVLIFLLTPVTNAPPGTVGSINLIVLVLVTAVSTITAPYGASLAHKTDAGRLKRIFAIFLALVALNMLYKVLA
ncbi:MAG: hypothetical protein DI498_06380 [Paracoccus denitrificans]|nr:MAG: hypothetical protein DI498_06380 [Paracoccus denitrificans]PZO84722.1 MAG: hypothetical protein DI633_06380 [Paracoccus denitrificans]